MLNVIPWSKRSIAVALMLLLCGVPQLIAQTQPSPPPQQTQTAPSGQSGVVPDPAQGPLQPVPTPEPQQFPDAPSAAQPAPATTPQPSQPAAAPQQRPATNEPVGTAAAPAPTVSGGPASKPAGTAIAPAKQRQVRSLVLKIGAIAAAGATLGIVYGLTRSTPSVPPNTALAATAPR